MSMNLEQMLKENMRNEIWDKYCGFLDLSMDEFMDIQERLLLEQIELQSKCVIGKRILGDNKPKSIEEFRKVVPLTTYDDYADVLLNKVVDSLPAEPKYWIQTSWEGGDHPTKYVPYSESMTIEHTKCVVAFLMLATSKKRGDFDIKAYDKCLYALAPLPYLTGIAPYILEQDITLEYLPPVKEAEKMTFEERNVEGFKIALNKGIDFFFGLSSVLLKVSESFNKTGKSSFSLSKLFKMKPNMIARLLKASMNKKLFNKEILPKDVFKVKGLVCAGTDSSALKKDIERLWGVKPLEIYGGTEITIAAIETWTKDGLVFFPDTSLLEFIPEEEYIKSFQDKSYTPKTLLISELEAGKKYELVITKFRGGVFLRYRVGDILECTRLADTENNINLPHFKYIDRNSRLIDLSSFTRLTAGTFKSSFKHAQINIEGWFAYKTIENNVPVLNLLLEFDDKSIVPKNLKDILNDSLGAVDEDYKGYLELLEKDPLKITILKSGVTKTYMNEKNNIFPHINPGEEIIKEILDINNK